MEELHFTGNSLKGSRPVLSFDASFDSQAHLRVIKELFTQIFGVPKFVRKSKPFVDRVMSFTFADGRIWIRCYQIDETEAGKQKASDATNGDAVPATGGKTGETDISLIEIGPRFLLTPIVILESSFGGPVIYENKEFVSPNQVRAEMRLSRAGRFNSRTDQTAQSKMKRGDLGLNTHGGRRKPKSELDEKILFS